MDRREILGALGAVGTSGCLRLQSGEGKNTDTSTDESTTEMAATAQTTRDTETGAETKREASDEPEYPTGLSDDGVTDFLYSTHLLELQQTSFRVQWTKFGLTNSHVKWQKEYLYDAGNALGKWTRQDGGPVEMYRHGLGAYWRENLGDNYTYGNDGGGNELDQVVWSQEIQPLLIAFDWGTPERANETRPAVWELTANEVETESAIPGYHQGKVLSVSSGSMRVDENGIIRTLEAVYRIRESGGDELTYETRFAIDSLGSVSVSEPDWLSTAKERIPTVSASLTDDDRFVKFVIESGNRIEANSRITVFDRKGESKTVVNLDEPVEPGTPAYIYRDDTESGDDTPPGFHRGRISYGEPPTSVSVKTFDSSYAVTAYRKTNRYFDEVKVAG